jgi:hypothetical protein
MAHFAELDNNNTVLRVLVVNNNELLDENSVEQEQKGIDFLQSLFGGKWVQTSYNSTFRKAFAGIGSAYDADKDVFYPVKPYPSWVFDEVDWRWKAPVPMPTEGYYAWDEENQNWITPE